MSASVFKELLPILALGKQPLLIYVFWLGAVAILTISADFAHQRHRTNNTAQNLYDIKLIAKHSHFIYWGGACFYRLVRRNVEGSSLTA
jgi:hypothetical protein